MSRSLTSDEVVRPTSYSVITNNESLGSTEMKQQVEEEGGWSLSRAAEDGGGHEAGYFCHPLDLRTLPSVTNLEAFPGLRPDLPTLMISECCLCYLEIPTASAVLQWFVDRTPSLGVVLYEPIGVQDAFGQMMVENLAARGIVMPTVQKYKTLDDQVERMRGLGFGGGEGGANAVTIEQVWEKWISGDERERVDDLEGLDEVEEWQMLARHYSVVWGWKGDRGWDGWRRL